MIKNFKQMIKNTGFACRIKYLLVLAFSLTMSIGNAFADDTKVRFQINDIELYVEYADTFEERQLGLMFRRQICAQCGMLFKFDHPRIAGIWMKNTYIPLDLAYITQEGEIVDIQALTPHDLRSVKSPTEVLYALEMNQGWFKKNNIKVGDKVTSLP